MRRGDEAGVAMVTVMLVLGSIALLMSGVYSLVSEGTRSARDEVRLEVTRSVSLSGTERVEALIRRVSVAGFTPAAPDGYGVQADKCDGTSTSNTGNGIWDTCQAFADFMRDELSRAEGDGDHYPGDPDLACDQDRPDIAYTVPTAEGDVDVAICVSRQAAGALPGSGAGYVFARAEGNLADSQSLFRVQVWATGPRGVLSQLEGVGRGIH